MTSEGETWQLGHRIEEPWGQARAWWELQPVTVVRPARGETTARLVCMTCDEAVECVVVSARARRRLLNRRSWGARAVSLVAGLCLVVLAGSTLGALSGAYFMAGVGEWGAVAGFLVLALIHGGFAAGAVPYLGLPRRGTPHDEGYLRLATPSPVHDLWPPSRRPEVGPPGGEQREGGILHS